MDCELLRSLEAEKSVQRIERLPRGAFSGETLGLLLETMQILGSVYLGQKLVGLVFLGDKLSKRPFTDTDLELLRTLCAVSAVTFNNARLFENARTSMNEVQRLFSLRTEMINRITHEFRTPLAAIKAVAECLPDSGLPGEICQALESSVDRLQELVESMLVLRSTEHLSAGTNFERFDPATVIHEFVSVNAKEAMAAGLTFEIAQNVETNPVALGISEESFTTIAGNLLKNAMRFSDKNSTIRIEMEILWRSPDEKLDGVIIADWQTQARKTIDEFRSLIASHDGQSDTEDIAPAGYLQDRGSGPQFVMRVTNTGIGIPSEDLRFIGEPFRQASNSPDRNVKGKALGLTIVQKLLKECQGLLCCRSVQGETTTFSVFLPVERSYTSAS
jgi:signal transduction histidine kinase